MPWFLRRRKKKHKKVAGRGCKDDTVVTATLQPVFAVVVQDFEASVSDQIGLERGQVVETLFAEEDWIYVRNVNGHCGYVPANFCFPLEKLRTGLPDNDESDKVRRLRAHPRPTTIHVDTFEAPPEAGGEAEGEGEEVVNSPDSGISCSQQASSSNMDSVHSLHNTRERLVGGGGGGGGENRVDFIQLRSHRQTEDREAEFGRSHAHVVKHSGRHKHFHLPNSSLPLLETAAAHTATSSHQTCEDRDVVHSPSPPPLQPVNLTNLRTKAAATEDHDGTTDERIATATTEMDGRRSAGASSDSDDVFLPEAKKPVGIFQCSETYEPKFEGEIPMRRDEVVVVMEVGRGEWVWAVGSENKEGLVPKSLLHKYRPDLPDEEEEEEEGEGDGDGDEEEGEGEGDEEEGEVDEREVEEEEQVSEEMNEGAAAEVNLDTVTSATQTELIINGVFHEITSSSQSSHSSSVVRDTATVSSQTEFTSPHWFMNNTPRTTPNNTLTRSTTVTTGTAHHRHSSQCTHTSSPHRRVLCHPQTSQSPQNSTSSASAATAASSPPTTASKRRVRYSNTPSIRHLPLTPVTTPVATPPQVTLQTPTSTSGVKTLDGVSNATKAASEESSSACAGSSAACEKPLSQVVKQQQVVTGGAGETEEEEERCRGHVSRGAGVTVAGTGTMQRHRQALSQHTRIVSSIPFEPDNEASTSRTPLSTAATRRRMQPTPIVTAVRDYSPPQRAKNALTLRRGDIMYAQTHVPHPHGWLWVYHTLLKKYGYVPKDCIAYMYLVQKDQSTILEDVV